MASTLVLLRHGRSLWNEANKFTGWVDVELSEKGEEEASLAQGTLRDFHFDAVFTSALKRSIHTADIVLAGKKYDVPRFSSEALNERRYGDLEGKNKDEIRKLYGSKQVHLWRRSFDIRPPQGESLKDTFERVLPYFKKEIKPRLAKGQCILISAHGNSLRALVKYLEHLSDEAITEVEIPTGRPLIYRLDEHGKVIAKELR